MRSRRMSKLFPRWVQMSFLAFMVVVVSQTGNAAYAAAPIAYLSYEQSTWKSRPSCNDHCRWSLYDPWNNRNFSLPVEGAEQYRDARISGTIANEGTKSLEVKLRENPNGQEKQRVEFEIANAHYHPYHRQRINESSASRYYGVAVYIHPQSPDTLKDREVTFMQAWQSHDVSTPKFPPFSLKFLPNTNYKWAVVVSKDVPVPGVDSRTTPGTQDPIYPSSPTGLAKGVWHEFIVWFKPSTQNAGAVKVWHNGTLAVAQTSNRNFGYEPQTTSPVMNKDFEVRFGAYRTSVPGRTGDITLLFDQAKYGTSYADVDP